jgi:adenylate cyclase
MQRAIPFAAAILAGALGLLGFVHSIELKTYDLRVAATARPAATADNIVLIAIDNESIQRMEPLVGRWPWPRLVHATLIDYLAAAGAKVIGYDILFAERDIRKFMVGDTEWTGAESDAALVESTQKAGNVVHAAEASSPELIEASRALVTNLDAPALNTRPSFSGCAESRPRLTPPFPELAAASRAIGHTLFTYDADGPLRRVSPIVQVGERIIPSFSMATTMTYGSTPVIETRVDDSQHCGVMIPWRGPAENGNGQPTFKSYSFYDLFYSQQQLLEGQKPGIDPALFKDRIVIIGVTAEGLKDFFTTSFPKGDISGPEVHANVIDAFLAHRSIVAAPRWATFALVLAAVLTVGVAGAFLDAWWTGAVAALFAAVLAWQSVALFARGIWIPVTVPGLATRLILPTAAEPIAIFTVRESVVEVAGVPVPPEGVVLLPAPPDDATIVAVPDALPARNLTTARPLRSVSASAGRTEPSVVVKMTRVPLCGGVPACSRT